MWAVLFAAVLSAMLAVAMVELVQGIASMARDAEYGRRCRRASARRARRWLRLDRRAARRDREFARMDRALDALCRGVAKG